MPLPTPNLDDRTFQDLVDEAKRMIPRYCPEWTDHNVSDPGVTLIELFAWMVDILLYRVNRVPEKTMITFMELLGMQLQAAQPARVELSFRLSAPAEEPVIIPRGTQAGTHQTTSEASIIFTTENSLSIMPPELIGCFTSPNERVFDDQRWKLEDPEQSFLVFSPRPRPGDAIYLGFGTPIDNITLNVAIDSSVEGIGINPSSPPLIWEYWTMQGWLTLASKHLERDSTSGFNQKGNIVLHMPSDGQKHTIEDIEAWWLRCVYTEPTNSQDGYSSSPTINTIIPTAIGGSIAATHSTEILNTVLGRSDGTPSQQFQFDYVPVLPRRPEERIEVQIDENSWSAWEERETFALSSSEELHYTIDDVAGTLIFGPAIREPNGLTRQYGAIPPRDALIRMGRYRTGGGVIGNVGIGKINVLQSAVPYLASVINREPATGGREAETIEHAALRAPQMLKTSFRAVTAEDFEYLTMQASTDVARVLCIQPQPDQKPTVAPGTVLIYVVPQIDTLDSAVDTYMFELPPRLLSKIEHYLDERRLLTTRLDIREPNYTAISLHVRIQAGMVVEQEQLKQNLQRLLYRYLHPVIGGSSGTGWTFGRTLYAAELYALLQQYPGVQYVEEISISTNKDSERVARIELPPAGLFIVQNQFIEVHQ